MLRYLTGGESHGKSMLAILDGVPAGLSVDTAKIDRELSRRMFGYGRGKRMTFESDKAEILSGVRKGVSIGSPISIEIRNVDHSIDRMPVVLEPRPGHADLTGVIKYGLSDVRDVFERASARETVARVGVGAICKLFLDEFGIEIMSHVTAIGGVESNVKGLGFTQLLTLSGTSPVRCADPRASALMCKEISKAMESGDSLGGVFEVVITGVPAGIGSYTQWDRKLDSMIASGMMSIQAIKGVSIGMGFDAAKLKGSSVHDEIFYDKKKGFYRKTNNAGGIEGGMSNGEDIIIRCAMKPIATLRKPLSSV
ncbi:MAG: chorismate synthase, partial [Candidatus Omnitrophota bacterium]